MQHRVGTADVLIRYGTSSDLACFVKKASVGYLVFEFYYWALSDRTHTIAMKSTRRSQRNRETAPPAEIKQENAAETEALSESQGSAPQPMQDDPGIDFINQSDSAEESSDVPMEGAADSAESVPVKEEEEDVIEGYVIASASAPRPGKEVCFVWGNFVDTDRNRTWEIFLIFCGFCYFSW
jgi:hypothetical protein